MTPDLHLVPPTGPVEPASRADVRLARPALRVVQAPQDAAVTVDVLPSSPPPEALVAVDHAARVAEDLHRQGRELHFRHDEKAGRVVVEVRDLDGRVLRTIPPTEALSFLEGGR